MKPKVSVVVPIYRVEKYLALCVDSLIGQTLADIEIILVDDGSPDRCGEIAEQYAKLDSRIQVIHQQNAGLGPARNTGIRAATGEYIGFVDSDDWVRPEMYQRLYDAAVKHGADIMVSGHCDVCDGEVVVSKSHPLSGQILNTREQIRNVRKNLFGHAPWDTVAESFPMSVCMSIYKRTLIQNNQLAFQNILSEDTIFNLGAYNCAESIAFTAETDYCYRKENQASITGSFSEKKLLQFQHFLTILANMAMAEGDEECVLRAKRMAIDYCRLYVGIVANSRLSFMEKREAIRVFAQNAEIKSCWEGYPIKTLPIQQRIFHRGILSGDYVILLILNWIRQRLKKKGWA